jgi:hypothetical protein
MSLPLLIGSNQNSGAASSSSSTSDVFNAYTYTGAGASQLIKTQLNIDKIADPNWEQTALLMSFEGDLVNEKTGLVDIPIQSGSSQYLNSGVFGTSTIGAQGINANLNCVMRRTSNNLGAVFNAPFCIEAWVRCNTGTAAGGTAYVELLAYQDLASDLTIWVSSLDNSPAQIVVNGPGINLSYDVTVQMSTLTKVRIAYDGTTVKIYVGGVFVTSAAWSGFANSGFTSIGCGIQALGGGVASSGGNAHLDDLRWTFGADRNADALVLPTAVLPRTSTALASAATDALVWIKARSTAVNHVLQDTVNGINNYMVCNATDGVNAWPNGQKIYAKSNGIQIYGTNGNLNTTNDSLVAFTFCKKSKFFDIVSYVGTSANRTISHNLGYNPGLIIVKCTGAVSNWRVYHSSMGGLYSGILNMNIAGANDTAVWNNTAATSTNFSVGGSADTNSLGLNYVAYIFANNTDADSKIKCGSYTGNGSINGPTVTLGWEPQFVLIKNTSNTGNWMMFDSERGAPTGTDSNYLSCNLTTIETKTATIRIALNATGFGIQGTSSTINTSGETYIFMAIRKSEIIETDATKVFNTILRTGTNAAANVAVPFSPDMILACGRSATTRGLYTKKLGPTGYLDTSTTNAALITGATQDLTAITSTGFSVGSVQYSNINNTGILNAIYSFKRSPKFLDIVIAPALGTTNSRYAHNLTIVPELIIMKPTVQSARDWHVYYGTKDAYLSLNLVTATTANANFWSTTAPTSTDFGMNDTGNSLASNTIFEAILFGTLPGVSKVGTYVGNGGSSTIDCGFTAGARFILIKRVTLAGDWFVWDTSRGIVAGNDPHLSLNTQVAEVTTDDSIDPAASGFIVNQLAGTNLNVSANTYLFLAIA